MKTKYLVTIVAATAFFSSCIGGAISYEFLRQRPAGVLRAQAIEIEDSKGRLRGQLGSERDGAVFLRFLSPEQSPVLFLGEQGQGPTVDSEAASAPILQMNGKDGRRSMTMTTSAEGNGVFAFDSEKRWNTLLLGYYPLDEEAPAAKSRFVWGLAVKRDYGETGIGVIDKAGPPAIYVSPQPSRRYH